MLYLFRRRYTLHVRKARKGWYVRAKAANGKTLFHTQTYPTKAHAERSAKGIETGRFVLA